MDKKWYVDSVENRGQLSIRLCKYKNALTKPFETLFHINHITTNTTTIQLYLYYFILKKGLVQSEIYM